MTRTVLRDVSQFLAEGWCQNAHALDERGRKVESRDPSAESWCLAGAVLASTSDEALRRATFAALAEAIRATHPQVGGWRGGARAVCTGFNDVEGRTADEVLLVVAHALSLSR